jgi:hypothetical protein
MSEWEIRDIKVRSKFINFPEYIGVFNSCLEVETILKPMSDTLRYVLWEKIITPTLDFSRLNVIKSVSDVKDSFVRIKLELFLSYKPVMCGGTVFHCPLKFDTPAYGAPLGGERFFIPYHGRNIYLSNPNCNMCPYTLFTALIVLRATGFISGRSPSQHDNEMLYMRSSYTKNKMRTQNKYKKTPWTLFKLSAFIVDNLFVLNRDVLYRTLPKSIYKDVVIEQSHLLQNPDPSNEKKLITRNNFAYYFSENLKC